MVEESLNKLREKGIEIPDDQKAPMVSNLITVLCIKQKNDRISRNPQTGETITIHARQILSFKPSAILKTAINKETP